jgi:hypothetical protein
MPLGVSRQQLAFDPGRYLFPWRLGPPSSRRQYRLFPRLVGDAKRQTPRKRCRRTQYIGGPTDESIDHRAKAFQLTQAIRARGEVGFDRERFAGRQDL